MWGWADPRSPPSTTTSHPAAQVWNPAQGLRGAKLCQEPDEELGHQLGDKTDTLTETMWLWCMGEDTLPRCPPGEPGSTQGSAQASSPSCFPTSLFQLLPTNGVRSSLGNSLSAPVEGCRGHKPSFTGVPLPRELVGFPPSDTNTDVTDWMLFLPWLLGSSKSDLELSLEQLSCPSSGV